MQKIEKTESRTDITNKGRIGNFRENPTKTTIKFAKLSELTLAELWDLVKNL